MFIRMTIELGSLPPLW